MPNTQKPQWSNIRRYILLLGNKELITQIKDLYAISDENRRFFEARFAQGQDQVYAVLADYKQEIIYCFFGERGIRDDLPRLRDARRLIRNYQKATRDSSATLDLKLHYVETGTEFTNTYGGINELFYNSLESMLVALKRAAYGIGWGYGAAVREILDDLKVRFEGR